MSWILERDRLPTFGQTKADFFLRTLFFLRLSQGKRRVSAGNNTLTRLFR